MRSVLIGRQLSRHEIGEIYFVRRGRQDMADRREVDRLTKAEGRPKRLCDLIIQDRYIREHS